MLLAVSIVPILSALPQFSWDTIPIFFHSSNSSGQYSPGALQIIAKFQMATIEKWMGYKVQGIDDEDEMVMAMKAIKRVNPKVATYFYMSSSSDHPEMARIAGDMEKHQDYFLCDRNGVKVKNKGSFYVMDLSKKEVRKWWLNICLNATKFADGDGCFCDGSQRVNETFTPELLDSKLKEWGEGLLNFTCEVQEALGASKLLIGKVANQSYVKAVQIEFFRPDNDSINSLMLGAQVGQVVQAHVPIFIP